MSNRIYTIFAAVICSFVVIMAIVFAAIRLTTVGDTPHESVGTDGRTEIAPATDVPTGTSSPEMTETEPVTETDPPETLPPLPDDEVREYDSFTVSGRYIPSEEAVTGLTSALASFGRPTGLIAIDIETGLTITLDADKSFAPASAIKVVFALYCFKQIDAGDASLDEVLTYTSSDKVYGDGVIGKMGVGAKLSLRDVIYHTLNTSDNEGYYMLLRRFGRAGCDKMTAALGCTTCKFSGSRWPKVTPRDLALVWAEIYRYKDETDGGRMLYEMLLGVEKMHFFQDALGYETAKKSGWNPESYNEGGIVYGDRTYILVVMSTGSYWTANKERFNDIVRAVNAMMSEYAASGA